MESSIDTGYCVEGLGSELSICFVDNEQGEAMVSSREVAAKFGKNHKDVLRVIESITSAEKSEFIGRNFALNSYTDSIGRTLPEWRLTKDGFSLVAMGFTGHEALAWKIRFIEAFNQILGYAVEFRKRIQELEETIQDLQLQLGQPKKPKRQHMMLVPVYSESLPRFPITVTMVSMPAIDVKEPEKTIARIIHMEKVIAGLQESITELRTSLGFTAII
jgi:Rha family phage regulatory protein